MNLRKHVVIAAVSCVGFGAASIALAQTASPDAPPKIIRIFREDVKPAKAVAHEKHEAGWPAAFAKANYSGHYVALSSVTGPLEAWFVEGHDSYASIEKADKEVEKNAALGAELDALAGRESELLNGQRAIIARFREDLSYHATPLNLAKARYIGVYTERVKPGYRLDYEESVKLDVAAYTKAAINNERWITYQVEAGAAAGTFIFFNPMAALAEGDIDNTKVYREALGESRLRQIEISRQAIASSEFQIFSLSPKMSYMPKEFYAVDPDFWTPKPVAKAPAGKAEPKPKP